MIVQDETSTLAGAGFAGNLPATCPNCRRHQCLDFFESESLPIHVGHFYDTQEAATNAPTADITLSYCGDCGMVFNRRFDLAKVSYSPGYEVALHHSAKFREFMEGVTERLIDRFDIRHKQVLEIGCGDGYFLRMLCQQGNNHAVGIDPTVPHEGVEQVGGGTVRFIRDYFSDRFADIPADFVCCLSVFEDIPAPLSFLKMLRRMLVDSRRPAIYFEVFNAYDAFEREETWSVHYEQCNYFSLESFSSVFQRAGFEVIESGKCYDGQYLFVDATPAGPEHRPSIERQCADVPQPIRDFASRHREKVAMWSLRLEQYHQQGKRVVVWGTGGKGITLLNSLDSRTIRYVVEINPDKQGKFVPGTGQEIVAPSFLAEYQPDIVIITNALYREEMQRQARELGVTAEFLVA